MKKVLKKVLGWCIIILLFEALCIAVTAFAPPIPIFSRLVPMWVIVQALIIIGLGLMVGIVKVLTWAFKE